MTNKEWLDYLAHNAPDELAAWFDAEHVEHQERALDGDTESENADSRERLEAEIESYSAFSMMDTITLDMVIGWLDRQAAITEEKTRYKWVTASAEEIAAWRSKAEKLKEQVYELTAERDKLEELNEYHALQYELASEDCDRLQAKVDELKAERVKLRSQICKLEDDLVRTSDERDNWKANCEDWKNHARAAENACYETMLEREDYRKKFGKCIDYADAIHALMDDEGMA